MSIDLQMISMTHMHPALFSLMFSNQLDLAVTPGLVLTISCNLTSREVISGHITATISYHLSQFLIAQNLSVNPSNTSKSFERKWSNFNQEKALGKPF